MTGEPPRNYTELDLLKPVTAQGLISAAAIDELLNPEARGASTPEEIKALETEAALSKPAPLPFAVIAAVSAFEYCFEMLARVIQVE